MTTTTKLSAEMKRRIAAANAGRPVPPTTTPERTIQPKGN